MNLIAELENPIYYNEVFEDILENNKTISEDFGFGKLLAQVKNKTFKWQPPVRTMIPKSNGIDYREIFIFPEEDALLQKTICKVLNYTKGHLINKNVFSYKKGMSIFNAADVVMQNRKDLYFIKVDISNYFLSVKHDVINNAIDDLIDDVVGKELLKSLFNINSYIDGKSREVVERYLSLMPGCALSSFFSNYVLKDVDALMCKECDLFIRYSDDMLLGVKDKNKLDEIVKSLTQALAELGLEIKQEKFAYYDKEDVIDFLGLYITEDNIALNKANMDGQKKLIKSICKSARKKCEVNHWKPIHAVKYTIRQLNGKYFKSVFDDSQKHKGNRVAFVFNSITDMEDLKQLDYYIKDRLNYVFSGKNNSKVYLNQSELEEMGFKSLTSMCYLFKQDKDIFYHYCWKMNKTIGVFKSDKYRYYPSVKFDIVIQHNEALNIMHLINYTVFRNCNIVIGNYSYSLIDIQFDYLNREIRVDDIVVIKDKKLMVDAIDIIIDDTAHRYNSINFSTKDNTLAHPDRVLQYYLYTCVNLRDYMGVKYVFTKTINSRQVINNFNINELKRKSLAQQTFYSYLYLIEENNLWRDAGFVESCGCMKYNYYNICIVLDHNKRGN